MKMHFNRMLLLAVFSTFGAADSMGQDLVAKIPFHFRTSNAELPAGTYTVIRSMTNSAPVLLLRNWETRSGVIVVARSTAIDDGQRPPRLVFQCGETGCSLAQIWETADRGYVFPAPREKTEGPYRTAVVYLRQKDIAP
jgi:hypothetical protein